jgi:predicted dehydrogenase
LKEDRARYTAVFNDGFRTEEEVRTFAETYGCKVYEDLDEMIDDIDLGLIHSCNWDKHIDYIMHFVRKGKPVFVDKPLVGNLKDCERLLALDKEGARILGTSALRFCYEVSAAKKKMAEEGSRPLHVVTTVGVDDYGYAIHAAEEILAIIDSRPKSCRYIGTAKLDAESEKCETYFVTFENGATATILEIGKKYAFQNTIIVTDNTKGQTDITFTPSVPTLYEPLMDRICSSIESGENKLSTMEEMVDAIKILLAGRASRDNGGITVELDSPMLYDVSFDGYEFERNYSNANRPKK